MAEIAVSCHAPASGYVRVAFPVWVLKRRSSPSTIANEERPSAAWSPCERGAGAAVRGANAPMFGPSADLSTVPPQAATDEVKASRAARRFIGIAVTPPRRPRVPG